MAQSIKTLIQRQKNKKPITNHIARECSTQKATSRESKSAKKVELIDFSNNILDQPIPDNVPLSLTLNSRIETPDVSPIKVIYCEAAIKQHPIYLLLDIGLSKKVEEKRSYIVQEDENKLHIVEIKKKTMSIEGKEVLYVSAKGLNSEEKSCIKCKELFKGIETLECLVDNLNEELGISHGTKEHTNLDKNQQAKVEELMKNNKFLFAEGLTQLERTKEEMHTIILKEEVKP
ncbi:16408_t:CDS:2, partial [Gigaspora margarita]